MKTMESGRGGLAELVSACSSPTIEKRREGKVTLDLEAPKAFFAMFAFPPKQPIR